MQNFILLIVFIHFFIDGITQQKTSFTIQGKFFPDSTKGKIYLYYPNTNSWIKDSCQIVNGSFKFTGELVHPVLGRFIYQNKEKEIFIEPTYLKATNINDDIEHMKIHGSHTQMDFDELEIKIRKIKTRWKSVVDTLSKINKKSNSTFQELKSWVLTPYFEEMRETYLEFFKRNPQSYATAYFLSINIIELNQGVMPTNIIKYYYDSFPVDVKNSMYGKQIAKELENRKIATPGTKSIDFTKKDLNGHLLSLASFRGKYVLLDFWGSWCIPCRKGNPHLKELYYRYKEKGFVIIGIAADNNNEKAWRQAIEKDDLPWYHILIDDLEAAYNIRSYPTKILIDREGNIIGRFGEDEEAIDKLISSIFSN